MSYNFLRDARSITNSFLCVHDNRDRYASNLQTNGDVDGWDIYNNIYLYGCWNGVLFGTAFDRAPYISRTEVFQYVEAEIYYILNIMMKITNNNPQKTVPSLTTARVQWTRLGDTIWDSEKQVEFDITSDDQWRLYSVNLGPAQWWQGNINNLRIFPFTDGFHGDQFAIKFIKLSSLEHYACDNPQCSYYQRYEHPCPGAGQRGYCEGASKYNFSTSSGVNDKLSINIDNYGVEKFELGNNLNYSGSEIARIIANRVSSLNVGGFNFSSVEYTEYNKLKIYSGTVGTGSSVDIPYSAAAEALGFYENGQPTFNRVYGTDPATGFDYASSRLLTSSEINKLIDGRTEAFAYEHDPLQYSVEGGRRDFLEVGNGRLLSDDQNNQWIQSFNNVGKTIIDMSHSFNNNGRITHIYVYGKADELSKVKILRPKGDGRLDVVYTLDFPEAGIGLQTSRVTNYRIDCNILVNKGDIIGIYSADVYVGLSLDALPNATFYQIEGEATGTIDPGQVYAYGLAGLSIYARGDRLQNNTILDIDLGNRINIEEMNIYGSETVDYFEFNILSCLDLSWDVDFFGETHWHKGYDAWNPSEGWQEEHHNIGYGHGALEDMIRTADNTDQGQIFTRGADGMSTFGDHSYFYCDGDAEWLYKKECDGTTEFCWPKIPTLTFNYERDPIAFTIYFPYGYSTTVHKTVMYFKERENFRGLALSYFAGPNFFEGNADDERFVLIPKYDYVSLDGISYIDNGDLGVRGPYIFSNPMQQDPIWNENGDLVNWEEYRAALMTDWSILEHGFEEVECYGFRLYTDNHRSTKISELEVYSKMRTTPSLVDNVTLSFSDYGETWVSASFEEITSEKITAFMGGAPRYMRLEFEAATEFYINEIECLVGNQVKLEDCKDVLLLDEAKTGAVNESTPVEIENVYGNGLDLTVDIPREISETDQIVFWSKLGSQDDVDDPEIGPGCILNKSADFNLRNDNAQCAINCPTYGLKNLVNSKEAYYIEEESVWQSFGTLTSGMSLEYCNRPDVKKSIYEFPPVSIAYWKIATNADAASTFDLIALTPYYDDIAVDIDNIYISCHPSKFGGGIETTMTLNSINDVVVLEDELDFGSSSITISDDFTGADGVAPDELVWIRSDVDAATITLLSGTLNFGSSSSNCQAALLQNAYDNFEIRTDFSIVVGPSTDSWSAGIQAPRAVDVTNEVVEVCRDYDGSQHRYAFKKKEAGTWSTVASVVTTDTNGKLRLTRSGETFRGYYWDGISWVLVGSYQYTALTWGRDTKIRLHSHKWNGNPSTHVQFDNFFADGIIDLGDWQVIQSDGFSTLMYTDGEVRMGYMASAGGLWYPTGYMYLERDLPTDALGSFDLEFEYEVWDDSYLPNSFLTIIELIDADGRRILDALRFQRNFTGPSQGFECNHEGITDVGAYIMRVSDDDLIDTTTDGVKIVISRRGGNMTLSGYNAVTGAQLFNTASTTNWTMSKATSIRIGFRNSDSTPLSDQYYAAFRNFRLTAVPQLNSSESVILHFTGGEPVDRLKLFADSGLTASAILISNTGGDDYLYWAANKVYSGDATKPIDNAYTDFLQADSRQSNSTPPYYAFDTNIDSYWESTDTPPYPHWIGYDFGGGNVKQIQRVNYISSSNYYPNQVSIQGSNDSNIDWPSKSWTTLITISGSIVNDSSNVWDFSNSNHYRYYRLYGFDPEANPRFRSRDIEMFEKLDGSLVLTSVGKTSEQSTTYPSYPASYGNDGNTGTFSHTSNGSGEWWKIDLGSDYDVVLLRLQKRSGYGSRPENYYIQTADDYAFTVNVVNIVTANAENSTDITYNVAATTRYLRILCHTTNQYLNIAEFSVYVLTGSAVNFLTEVSNANYSNYLAIDLEKRHDIEIVRNYGDLLNKYVISATALVDYSNTNTADVNSVVWDNSDQNDARWMRIELLCGDGTTRCLDKLGIYPDISTAYCQGGGYNCEWQSLGTMLSDYTTPFNVAFGANISGTNYEFRDYYPENAVDGISDDYTAQACWGLQRVNGVDPRLELEFDDTYTIDTVILHHGTLPTSTAYMNTDYTFYVNIISQEDIIITDDFTGSNGDVPDFQKWTRTGDDSDLITIQNNTADFGLSSSSHQLELIHNTDSNFVAEVDFTILIGPDTDSWEASVQAQRDMAPDKEVYSIGRRYEGGQHVYTFDRKVRGTWTTVSSTTTTDTSGKLRLSRIGETFTGYYWSGSDWVLAGTYDHVSPLWGDESTVRLSSQKWDDSPSTNIQFDNFRVTASGFAEGFVEVFSVANNSTHDRIHKFDPIDARRIRLLVTGYDSEGFYVYDEVADEYVAYQGSFLREIEIYTATDEGYVDSETWPVVCLNLIDQFGVQNHALINPDPEATDTDWDNNEDFFRYSDNIFDDPEKVAFNRAGSEVEVFYSGNTTGNAEGSTEYIFNYSSTEDLVSYNGPQITSEAPDGYANSYRFRPGSSAYLTVPYSSDFDLSSGDWTIEAWFRADSFAGGMAIISKDTQGANYDWSIYIKNSTTFWLATRQTIDQTDITVPTMNTGQWYHVAYVRSGSTNTLYLDGVAYGSTGWAITNDSQSYVTMAVGGWNNPYGYFQGNLSEIRVSKGISRYTADFIPPSAPFVSDPYTSLLIHPSANLTYFEEGVYHLRWQSYYAEEENEISIRLDGPEVVDVYADLLATGWVDQSGSFQIKYPGFYLVKAYQHINFQYTWGARNPYIYRIAGLTKWISVTRDTATEYSYDGDSSKFGKDYLTTVKVFGDKKYNPTEYEWWWNSSLSTLSTNPILVKTGRRSLQIDYPTSSGSDTVSFIEGDDWGDDMYFTEKDMLSFWWYIDDVSNLDTAYGDITFGVVNNYNPMKYTWDITNIDLTSGWNFMKLQFDLADHFDPVPDYKASALYHNIHPDLNFRLNDTPYKSLQFRYRGTGLPLSMNIDDLHIRRNKFEEDAKFGKGLFLSGHDHLMIPVSTMNLEKGAIELWLKMTTDSYGIDTYGQMASRTYFTIINNNNEIVTFAIRSGHWFQPGTGHVRKELHMFEVDDATRPLDYYFGIGELVHVAIVWDNEGKYLEAGDTMRFYLNGELTARSNSTWTVSDTKSTTIRLGGTSTQTAYNGDMFASGVFDNVKLYNYCKTDFNPEVEGIEKDVVYTPNNYMEISDDNVNFYGIDSPNLPLFFEDIPSGDKRTIYVRANKDSTFKQSKNDASLIIQWLTTV